MKAKVVSEFNGVPPGEVYPRLYTVGEMLEGEYARMAVANGWAEPLKEGSTEKKPKAKKKPASKAHTKAPRNKSL